MKIKEKKLLELYNKMQDDSSLPLTSRFVAGFGNCNADIIFIGEAPGANEEKQGLPFVGLSGKRLDLALKSIGLERRDVFITNMVKKRPPANRDPKPSEIKKYRSYLEAELEIIKPKIIVPLGRIAFSYFFSGYKISEHQGRMIRWGRYCLLPMYHPSATFRRKKVLEDYLQGFQMLKKIINKKILKIGTKKG